MIKNVIPGLVLLVISAASTLEKSVHAEIVLDLNFAELQGGGAPTDGQLVAATDFAQTNVFDSSGYTYTNQALQGLGSFIQYAAGVSPAGSIPEAPPAGTPDFDGFAIRSNGRNYVRYPNVAANDPLIFESSFSAWTRVYREGNDTNVGVHYIFGGGHKNNFGWGVYATENSSDPDDPYRLDVFLGGDFSMFDSNYAIFEPGEGPILPDAEWLDIGITYSGIPFDGQQDTLKVFLNGEIVATRLGDADFDPTPFGQAFSFGMDTFGNQGFKGLYDRILLWNEAVDDSVIMALSAPAGIEGDYNENGVVDAADYVVWRDGLGAVFEPADYNVWKANFGNSAGSGTASTAAIPEPSTSLLLLLTTAGTCLLQQRRHGRFRSVLVDDPCPFD